MRRHKAKQTMKDTSTKQITTNEDRKTQKNTSDKRDDNKTNNC